MASQTEENYLKALLSLSYNKEDVTISELSNFLRVRLPTVNSMVKKLKKQGLVNYEKYRPLSLTPEGKMQAALILRKHRLTEMYLVEKMGFGWEEVHEIAEQVEHINSSAFFERMDEQMGHPATDPHGSPIPDKNGNIALNKQLRLSEAKKGSHVRLAAIVNGTSEFLSFLNRKELNLGTAINVLEIEPFDKSISVSYANHEFEILSHEVCNRIYIEILDESITGTKQ